MQATDYFPQTIVESGRSYVKALGNGEHLLFNRDAAVYSWEVWGESRNRAGYALVHQGTDLEFCRAYEHRREVW